jgi:hypothetical protein
MRGRQLKAFGEKATAMIVLAVATAGLLSACGGSSNSNSGASELARQRELSEARHQAAQDARQAAKIKNLERELHNVAHQKSRSRTPRSDASPLPSSEAQAPVAEPGSGDWPGGTGFTAILASVSSEGEARSIQSEATGRGLDAGVLYSSYYSSLRPGYWVVFSGVFPSADGAEARVGHAHELGFSDAYPRFVAP